MKKSEILSSLLCYSFEKEFNKFSNRFVIKIDEKEYPNKIFWFIDNKWFMEYELKTGNLWCDYYNFWEYFKTKFDFNGIQVKHLIKFMVKKHFNLNKVIPTTLKTSVEKHFNLNKVTPKPSCRRK